MNRFEVIAERIGVWGKDIDTDSSWYYLKIAFRELEGAMRDKMFDSPVEEDYIKRTITDTLFYLLVLASKNDHCGACMCGDLEDKLRVLEEIRAKLNVNTQPTVINKNNIPAGVAEGLESDIQKISERAAGKYRYLISCDVFSVGGYGIMVSSMDVESFVSLFTLAVDPDLILVGDLFFEELVADINRCTGVEWKAEKTAGFVAIKHYGRVEKINLDTNLVIAGENIRKL